MMPQPPHSFVTDLISSERKKEPFTSLSRLLMVDRSFNAAIMGSPRLQRAFLEKAKTSTDQEHDHIMTLSWFAKWAFDLHLHSAHMLGGRPNRYTFFINTVWKSTGSRGSMSRFLESGARFLEATWRNIQIDDGNLARIIDMGVHVKHRTAAGHYRDHYVTHLRFTGGSTLHEVFKEIAKILDRSPNEHLVAGQESHGKPYFEKGFGTHY